MQDAGEGLEIASGEELFSSYLKQEDDGSCPEGDTPMANIDHLDFMMVYVQGVKMAKKALIILLHNKN